jgi:hypothetical protein
MHAGSTHSTPRWVKGIGIMVIILVLLFASLHLVGRGIPGHAFGGHGDHTAHGL